MDSVKLIQEWKLLMNRLTDVSKEYSQLKREYEKIQQEIGTKYMEKLSELENETRQKEIQALEEVGISQKNIISADRKLVELQKWVSPRDWGKYEAGRIVPQKPDFLALQNLAEELNGGLFGGAAERFMGEKSRMNKVRNYLDLIEAGRQYLAQERAKNQQYVSQKKLMAEKARLEAKEDADRRKAQLTAQNEQWYAQSRRFLDYKMISAVRSPELEEYDQKVEDFLEQMGGYDEGWDDFSPSVSFPEQVMLGAVSVPLNLPSAVIQAVENQTQLSFCPGKGLLLPLSASMRKPLRLMIQYEPDCKEQVMEGVQCILMKWLRFMPLCSFTVTCIDPNDRGSNLGQLLRLEEITSWDVCSKICASREDITARLKALEKFVDQTCAELAGTRSVYEARRPFVRHLLMIHDFPDNMENSAITSLKVLMNNAEKCGISLIFTGKHPVSGLPEGSENPFWKIKATAKGNTIQTDKGSYDFCFDTLPISCSSFLDSVRAAYRENARVDNHFSRHFSSSRFQEYWESTQSLRIPFAVDSAGRVLDLHLGGASTAHGLLSGSTGSGKSTTLHMLITSIVLHYHPDDVELWLVDYAKVEFAEYMKNCPPHVKLIGLEQSAEFTYSLLEKVDAECRRRMELFKKAGVRNITEYKQKYGARSLPRIVLIVDEFHRMTQAVQEDPLHKMILENMLTEYRKFGLTCIFSDQSVSAGLKGLTDKGRNQLHVRMAMMNDVSKSEIRETLAMDSSFYTDDLNRKINTMTPGDMILKRNLRDADGNIQIMADRYRVIKVSQEERAQVCRLAQKRSGREYEKPGAMMIDGYSRKPFDENTIFQYEREHGGPTENDIPIYAGTPASLEPCFRFSLQDRLDSNIMMIGADTEMRASVVLNTIRCFSRIPGCEIAVFADERDELYSQYREELNALSGDHVLITSSPARMCPFIRKHVEDIRNHQRNRKTLIVWLGLESIGSDMSMFPDRPQTASPSSSSSHSAVDDLIGDIDSLIADFENGGKTHTEPSSEKEIYDARSDIGMLIANGSRFGIHSLVTCPSVKMLRQFRFIDTECFEHKIAFSMSRDDWSNYLSRAHYAENLDDMSAAYYDGSSSVKIFRPYLLR